MAATELPVIEFIRNRLLESDPQFDTRRGTAFFDLFIQPQQLMLNPLITAMETSLTSQSVRRMRNLSEPDAFDESLVDDAVANVYVTRNEGAFARAVVRVLYSQPFDKEFPDTGAEFLTGSGLSFFNEGAVAITAEEMALNTEGDLFYVDIPVRAQTEGADYNVPAGDISVFVNDPEAVTVRNDVEASGGFARETNTEVLDRAPKSIGVRDLETVKGINGILNEKFPGVFKEITPIGMGDQEMMRDIVYNAHVGGNTDIYLKTPSIVKKTFDIVGLEFDFTRELQKISNLQLTATDFTDPASDLRTPNIVVGSVSVKSDTVETAAEIITASVPAGTGINLSAGEYIKLKVDSGSFINVKVSGAVPSQTQKFEIINSINAAVGLTVASPYGVDKIKIKSQVVGVASRLEFATPDAPRTDGTPTLIPDLLAPPYNYVSGVSGVGPNPAALVLGDVATVYIENVDYEVEYTEGKIKKLPGSAILSGDTIVSASDGSITTGSDIFTSPNTGEFANVNIGDYLNVVSSTGIASGQYIVRDKIDNETLRIGAFSPTGNDNSVSYNIVSNQVVVVTYKYNPLSIDIGGSVILSDGVTRGIRPGREEFTITDIPYLDVVSIEEIDPDTLEGLNVFLNGNGGYGSGGYGLGPYGIGSKGDYQFIVNRPQERFSMFEDSILIFDPTLLGKSYRITYYTAPEIASVHTVSRDDLERVTGADVLPKNYAPGFVDMEVPIRRDPANADTPTNEELAVLVADYINNARSTDGVIESSIIHLLEGQGVDSIQNPFEMKLTVVNTDGSSEIVFSTDILKIEERKLPKETANYVTPRITHFYARNVSVVEV